MTVKQARDVLGIEALSLSDEDLINEIEIAELLKEIYFATLSRVKKKPNLPISTLSNVT